MEKLSHAASGIANIHVHGTCMCIYSYVHMYNLCTYNKILLYIHSQFVYGDCTKHTVQV